MGASKVATCDMQRERMNLLLTTRAAARGLVATNVAHFADKGLEVEDSVASHVVIPPRWAKYALGRTGPAVRSLGTRACTRVSSRLVAVASLGAKLACNCLVVLRRFVVVTACGTVFA